jgi:putative nucleotidyltransferase with HDIG domain
MSGERILVVDDDELIRDVCSHILSSKGYGVTAVSSGKEALEELSGNPVDLLITDMNMPVMDGLELFEQVKKLDPDIVTVVITGQGTLGTAIESLMRGIEGFILKPFTEEELVNTVERAVTRSRLQKENIRLKALIPLFEISKLLVTEIDLARLFRIVTEVLVKEFSAERVSLMLQDASTGVLAIRDSHGLSKDLVRQAKRRIGEGVAGLVIKRRQPLIITKGKHPDPEVMEALNRDEMPLSSMSVPLIGKDTVMGVLNISTFSGPPFTTSHLQIVSVLASQVVAVMENASLYQGLHESYFRTVQALVAAVEAKDPYTRWHSTNVATYAEAIARDMGLNAAQLEEVHIAAILHDVGKIGISERIIGKPGRLSQEEYNIMKDHPAHGLRILEPIGFSPAITTAIYQHHERFDGKGYPQGFAGDKIVFQARILAVADTIDAMSSERPYRGIISTEQVMRELDKEAGCQFDPIVARTARRMLEKGHLKPGMQAVPHQPAAERTGA